MRIGNRKREDDEGLSICNAPYYILRGLFSSRIETGIAMYCWSAGQNRSPGLCVAYCRRLLSRCDDVYTEAEAVGIPVEVKTHTNI